jgi:four helix bundle protein
MKNQEPRTKNLGVQAADEPYSFRKLILWQKAQGLALEIVKIAAALPNDRVASVLARQIVRSASSVSANIAEGHGRYSLAAHRNHLSIAKGSACETDGWLDLLHRAGYLDAKVETRLHESCLEIVRMLTSKILDLERRERDSGRKVRENRQEYVVEPPDDVSGRF